MISRTVALEEYLKPLNPWLQNENVSEILINQPEKMSIEENGMLMQYDCPALTFRHVNGLANLIARYTEQRLSEKEPLLSSHLPEGHRIQIILPPATAIDRFVLSIRKQVIKNISLDEYEGFGVFKNTVIRKLPLTSQFVSNEADDQQLSSLLHQKRFCEFMKHAVRMKKNILVSGATSTGKTTFMNACLKEIPSHEHIVTLEDVPELFPTHTLHTPLFASKGLQGTAKVTMQDLLQASLRIRPDRIILGELRGAETADYINATATGHDGSLSSVHASSIPVSFMRLVHMMQLNGMTLSRESILEDLHTLVHVVVHLKRRIENNRYIREVSEVYFSNFK